MCVVGKNMKTTSLSPMADVPITPGRTIKATGVMFHAAILWVHYVRFLRKFTQDR